MHNKKTRYRLKTNLPIDGAGECFSVDEWFSKYGYVNISTLSKFFEEVIDDDFEKGLNSINLKTINKNI